MMQGDLRNRAKVPYGYRIVDGRALIDSQEAAAVKQYFRAYLDGESMSQAAQEAGLPCSQTTLRRFFNRKEYIGTDFYPAIITEAYQKKLIQEYESRKGKRTRTAPTHPKKGVAIYKDFRMVKMRAYSSDDPVSCAAAFYQQIRPKRKQNKTTVPDR